jgi:DNA-binding response OmpR family regulator
MLNIAVVEDNDDLRAAIVGALHQEGHHVIGIDSAEALVEHPRLLSIDLLVVDINLPGEDGLTMTRRVRSAQPDIGVIMVTARGRTLDRQLGYESGADIYMTKPISVEELTAAIEALSRRLHRRETSSEAMRLDGKGLVLQGKAGAVPVSAAEAALLAAFARAPDRRLETWQILELTDPDQKIQSRSAVNVIIFRLSRRLRQAGAGERPLRAIRGWGYQLVEPLALG